MPSTTFTVTIDNLLLVGIAAARILHNSGLPLWDSAEHVDPVDGSPVRVPNPAILDTDQEYIQYAVGEGAAKSWYESTQHMFRIPTGEWLLRFTMDEKRGIRAIGAGKYPAVPAETVAAVQGFLDRLDESPIVNLSDNDVEQGVPMVFSLLASVDVIPQSSVAERVAAIQALNMGGTK